MSQDHGNDEGVLQPFIKHPPKIHPNLGMDNHWEREGLHLYMTEWDHTTGLVDRTISVHLTREQARILRDEINRRLF